MLSQNRKTRGILARIVDAAEKEGGDVETRNIKITQLIMEHNQKENQDGIDFFKHHIQRVLKKIKLPVDEKNINAINALAAKDFHTIQIERCGVYGKENKGFFLTSMEAFLKSTRCNENIDSFIRTLKLSFAMGKMNEGYLFTPDNTIFWEKVNNNAEKADYYFGIAVIYAIFDSIFELDKKYDQTIRQHPEYALSLAAVFHQLQQRKIFTKDNIIQAIKNQRYAYDLALLLQYIPKNVKAIDCQRTFDSALQLPAALPLSAHAVEVAQGNIKMKVFYYGYEFDEPNWYMDLFLQAIDNAIIAMKKNYEHYKSQRDQACFAFLMGTHSRLGAKSPIFKFFGVTKYKPNHTLGDIQNVQHILKFV